MEASITDRLGIEHPIVQGGMHCVGDVLTNQAVERLPEKKVPGRQIQARSVRGRRR